MSKEGIHPASVSIYTLGFFHVLVSFSGALTPVIHQDRLLTATLAVIVQIVFFCQLLYVCVCIHVYIPCV